MTTLSLDHTAIVNSRSIYQKNIHDAANYPYKVIKVPSDVKLGKKVKKGRLKGSKIYILTLEERATCDSDCEHWLDCYGNNMPFAHRFEANDNLYPALERDLNEIDNKNKEYLLRLHILGDFFSKKYIHFWAKQLEKRKLLNIYGYTRNHPTKELGLSVLNVRNKYGKRFAVRFSNYPDDPMSAQSENVSTDGVGCPHQLGLTESCGSCGICWLMNKPVIFYDH
tara:strand:+ start:858 stop:1529 length:672 start_codon:yes stop_codon:yes gene_type:complete